MKNTVKSNIILLQSVIIKGLQSKLASAFDTTPELLTSSNDIEIVGTTSKALGKKINYPYSGISLASISKEVQTYGPSMARRHAYGQPTKDSSKQASIQLVPAMYTFEYLYVTDDYDDVLKFIGRWFASGTGKGGKLNMVINYYGLKLPITVIPDVNLTTPKYDRDESLPAQFNLLSSIQLNGYVTSDLPSMFKFVDTLRTQSADKTDITIEDEPSVLGTSPFNINIDIGDS